LKLKGTEELDKWHHLWHSSFMGHSVFRCWFSTLMWHIVLRCLYGTVCLECLFFTIKVQNEHQRPLDLFAIVVFIVADSS